MRSRSSLMVNAQGCGCDTQDTLALCLSSLITRSHNRNAFGTTPKHRRSSGGRVVYDLHNKAGRVNDLHNAAYCGPTERTTAVMSNGFIGIGSGDPRRANMPPTQVTQT